MNKFQKAFNEAMDFQGKPDVWNPDIKREIESGEEHIGGVVSSQEYLEAIHSEEYIDLINRITRLTGIPENQITTQRVPSIIARAGAAFGRIAQIETQINRQDPEFFPRLAVETILGLSEFQHMKKAVDAGQVKIDIKSGPGEMQKETQQEQEVPQELEQEAEEEAEELENEDDTTPMENQEFDLYQELLDDTEKKLRKRLMNSLMQGNAVNKFQVYHLVTDRINEKNPELLNLYAITTTLPQLAYHNAPSFVFPGDEGMDQDDGDDGGDEPHEEGAMGSETIYFDENGIPVIKVRGATFPLLCHELTKGIYELLSYHEKEVDIVPTNPKVERKDTLHGTPLWKKFVQHIPHDKQNLIPGIFQKFTRIMDDEEGQGIDKIKAVFSHDEGASRRAMNGIIREVETEMQAQQQKVDDWDEEQDRYQDTGGEDEPEGEEDRGF